MIRVVFPDGRQVSVAFQHLIRAEKRVIGEFDGKPIYSNPFDVRYTTATLFRTFPSTRTREVIAEAEVRCDPRDNFNKCLGRKYALKHLLAKLRTAKLLNHEERTQLCKEVFRADPRLINNPTVDLNATLGKIVPFLRNDLSEGEKDQVQMAFRQLQGRI